jgi:hypothetical protein
MKIHLPAQAHVLYLWLCRIKKRMWINPGHTEPHVFGVGTGAPGEAASTAAVAQGHL